MKSIYFFLLSAMLGIELFIGICVAPIVFFPAKFSLDLPLTIADSGLLMSKIFVRMGEVLLGVSIWGVIYSFWNRKALPLLLAYLILLVAGGFVFYLTPLILQAQDLGTTNTEEFAKLHRLSEYSIKLMAVLQALALILLATAKPKRTRL